MNVLLVNAGTWLITHWHRWCGHVLCSLELLTWVNIMAGHLTTNFPHYPRHHTTLNEMMAIRYSTHFCHMHPTPEALHVSFLGRPAHSWAFSTPWRISSYQTQIYMQGLSTLQLPSLPIVTWVECECRMKEGPLSSLTLLSQCEKPDSENLHIGAVQHWMPTLSVQRPPIQVLTTPTVA